VSRSSARLRILAVVLATFAALAVIALVGFRTTTHPAAPATLGVARSADEMEASLATPGPVVVETVVGADWKVPRSGLINLDHPEARAAGLTDGEEPIQIYVHVLRHPTRGTFLVDSGVERALRDDPDDAAVRGVVARFMGTDAMQIGNDTASVVAREKDGIAGVLLTHLHLDHITGMPDVPRGTAIYTGPGEAGARNLQNMFAQGNADRALAGHAPLGELAFTADPTGRFAGVLDLFGDGSVWAIWVPGHTPGSVAYLVRTPEGPVLLTGDTCHTAWGWQHGVEPGSFTADHEQNARSLAALRELAARHPSIDVRPGHQSNEGPRRPSPHAAKPRGAPHPALASLGARLRRACTS